MEKGRRVFSPIGGALQLKAQTDKDYLVKMFGATDFENKLDLRFQAPDDQEAAIKKWFHSGSSRQRREASALRELKEELVDENKILTMKDLESVHETSLSHFCDHWALKEDFPEPGKRMFTTYIVEVYNFMASAAVIDKMKRHSAVYFADESEIAVKNPRTRNGDEIGDITKTILRNR
jgi:hypothetical protein